MPEVEPLRFASREGGPKLQDQGDLQAVCTSRRRSCALVNTPSPCVNKAICHIQELKRKLENWCQQQSENAQHQKSLEKPPNSKTFSDSDNESVAELYIEGIRISARECDPRWSPLKKETTNVLVEVVHLVERLEADRQDAKVSLQTETEKRKTMERVVDNIMLWKQMEFPVAVQREHDACSRDISELKWHLKLRGEKLSKVKDKFKQTEVVNKRLHEDIAFVEKYGPLMREKLEIESDIMNHIQKAQVEANDTFAKTTNDLHKTEEDIKKLSQEIQAEEGMMAHVIKTIHGQLNDILSELKDLQVIWSLSCKNFEKLEEETALKVGLCDAMSERIPGMEQHEAMATGRVLELNEQIGEEDRAIEELKEQISELQKIIDATRQALEKEASHLEEVYRKKRSELMALHAENKENELEFADYTKKIHNSQQAVKQLQKDKKRMLVKIDYNQTVRDQAKNELSLAEALHNTTKGRVEVQEQQAFLEEQQMRKATECLKKELMGDMKTLAILKNKMSMIQEDLRSERNNSELAKQELQNEFESVTSTISDLEVELENLKKIYDEKSKNIETLTNRLMEIKNKLETTSKSLEEERNLKLDHLIKAKEFNVAVKDKFSYTFNRINTLTAKSKEYQATSERMKKMSEEMPDVVSELQSVFDAVAFKHQSASLIMNTLQLDVTSCQQRTEHSIHVHSILFSERQKKMEDIKSDLKNGLRENMELAREYIKLQKLLMVAKQEAVCVSNKRNQAEMSLHEYKQLSLLQERMHKAMEKYFKQRSLYSQAGLAHCQALSVENNQKIKTVQEQLSKVIQRVSAFLHSLTDDSTAAAADGGAANKQAGRDAAGLNKKLPPVQIAV